MKSLGKFRKNAFEIQCHYIVCLSKGRVFHSNKYIQYLSLLCISGNVSKHLLNSDGQQNNFSNPQSVCARVLLCRKNIPSVWLGAFVWGFYQSRVWGAAAMFSWLSWMFLLGFYNSGILFPIHCKNGLKKKISPVPSPQFTTLRSVLF